MALYTTIHLHNVPAGREAEYAAWFDGAHREALPRLRGFRSADRYEVAAEQIMADIAGGCAGDFRLVTDRAEAISLAIQNKLVR